MTIKIYDCSNSEFRPPHRDESMGPKQNDVMRCLHGYAKIFGCSFVDSVNEADVVITNDVFPPDIAQMDIPKVKRMDGIYWDKNRDRNAKLNEAALLADHVVFISNYSAESYSNLIGGNIKKQSVVLNEVDPSIFKIKQKIRTKRFTYVACVSNWERKEKRFEDLKTVIELVRPYGPFVKIIGKCDGFSAPDVQCVGHQDAYGIAEHLQGHCVFINLSYRDACPKVICQANNCGLPIIYANSGGTPEIIWSGVAIADPSSFVFEDETPRLNRDAIQGALEDMHLNYKDYSDRAYEYKHRFWQMLLGYFDAIKGVV